MVTLKARLLESLDKTREVVDQAQTIVEFAEAFLQALVSGRTVFLVASEGASYLAQHAAEEFVAKFGERHRALPVVPLTGDSRLLASIGSDYGTAEALSRQVRTFVRRGDVVLSLATEPKCEDLVAAVNARPGPRTRGGAAG